ncbi:MAG TPA: aminoglycoside 3'-phosphotransferase [Epulopiscium sp.]|nr:aminoglycoside 3'-phosphotransferase [Candidatus Epulonipiscium sp.]
MLVLPDKIKNLIGNESFSYDDVGMSDSTVIIFTDKVLKIQSISKESEHEYQVMEWLQDKLPLPRVLAYEKAEDKNYLLMTKVSGEMSCADQYMRNPEKLANLLAEGLKMLWKVDISNCTYMHGLDEKLQMAKYNVQNNLVDMENVEPETFGENGFESSEHLLKWLITNRPEEELVFSHGDFCLPNIFLSGDKISGYIDLGKAGIADRWQDIALCYRSLLHNFEKKYCDKKYQGFRADILFEKLDIVPDWDKIRYYILLDELF